MDKGQKFGLWFSAGAIFINALAVYASGPNWLTLVNALCAGLLIAQSFDIVLNAGLSRAKDELIETLEHNQNEFMRFLDNLNEAGKNGPFEVSVERVDDPDKPKQVH